MSKIEVNTVEPQCGTTLTLGGSGDTVTLGSGASQSGFGREGSVDWQTSVKTATFTAANGEGYFCDTTSGAFTVNLPAASVGNIVAIKDYAGTFQTNNLTITPNGSDKIDGINGNATISTENASITLVFADSTRGWLNVNDSTTVEGTAFITATGGTITTVCTNFKVHTFTGPGTFEITGGAGPLAKLDYLVVGGGGAGGTDYGGGGGAGGFRESKTSSVSGCWTASPLVSSTPLGPFSPGSIPVTVGAGGAPVTGTGPGGSVISNPGNNSVFSTITSAGGGRGGSSVPSSPNTIAEGGPGGSGGGGSWCSPGSGTPFPGGTGNTPSVSPPQGQNGGLGRHVGPSFNSQGGGGGATAAGGDGGPGVGGANGGAGATTSINGTPTAYAGGGGAVTSPGAGGTGGGGGGNPGTASTNKNGTANSGGGGGGQGYSTASGSGGSGIVIIRYKFQ